MIWNYIRDFLVQYIFGGVDSSEEFYRGAIGYVNVFGADGNDEFMTSTADIGYNVGHVYSSAYGSDVDMYMRIGDWLSTTFTIIIMCMIVVFAIWLVRWVYKTVVSAFLLK